MNVFKWALAGAGGLVVAAIIAVSALGGGISQAEENERTARAAAFEQAMADRLGITVEALHAARQGALDDVLAAAVASGRITQAQADEIKENPRAARRAFLKNAAGHVRNFAGDLLGAAADTIGISKDEVKEGLKNGQSLAQIAQTNGVSVEALKAGIIAEVEAKLDAAVAANNLTQQRADEISAALPERVDQLVNRTGGQGGPGGMVERLRERVKP